MSNPNYSNWDFARAPKQDMPPPGGFPYVKWKRFIPTKGFHTGAFLCGSLLAMCYGTIYRFNENRAMRYPHDNISMICLNVFLCFDDVYLCLILQYHKQTPL